MQAFVCAAEFRRASPRSHVTPSHVGEPPQHCQADRRTVYYAKLRKGGSGDTDSTEAEAVTDTATESEPATAPVVAVPEPEDTTGTDDQATADQGDEQEKSDAGN